ncbi:MAG: radical SAM protein [Phycisphaerae bacterium]|nr:radical SAM protein [Phycisphaerae bacterium]
MTESQAQTQVRPERESNRYLPPPVLAGYTYSGEEAYAARDAGQLLAIRVETNRTCNLRCRYCYAESGAEVEGLTYAQIADVVGQAAELDARSVVVIGGGEPTIWPRFRDLVSLIDALHMIPMIFSNTVAIDRELAEFLAAHNASVMGKLDSLRPDVQDFLAGEGGAAERIMGGLRHLMEAGLVNGGESHRLRLGVSCVTSRVNLDEIEDIWHFCRANRVFPNLEVLTPTGRAKDHLAAYYLTAEQITGYKRRLLEVDRRFYGYDWLPYTPLTASGCLQHLYSLYISLEGNVRPCAPTKFDQHPALLTGGQYPHNVRRRSLRGIYDDELFRYVRHIDVHLEGKCSGCEHLRQCIGCRGYAYSVGVNEGKDPREALRSECRQCFK